MDVTAYAVIEPSDREELRDKLLGGYRDHKEIGLTIRSIDLPVVEEKEIGFFVRTISYDGFSDLFAGSAIEGDAFTVSRLLYATLFLPAMGQGEATIAITPLKDE